MKILFFPIILFLTLSLFACVPTNNSSPEQIQATSTEKVPTTTQTPAPTVTETPRPTETPAPLMIDITKQYMTDTNGDGTLDKVNWDLSRFSEQERQWLMEAMTDPGNASPEAKRFYDKVCIEGIRALTGDPRIRNEYSSSTDRMREEVNVMMGFYAEYLFSHGIREVAPLPFVWRKAILENQQNIVPYNRSANRGYFIEGHDSLFSDPTAPNSIEGLSKASGIGYNYSPLPTRTDLEGVVQFRIDAGNQTRDTIFGESSLFIYPGSGFMIGDLMGLTSVAGVVPDIAQEAIVRMFDERDGTPRYYVVRIQYAKDTADGIDKSCARLQITTTMPCPEGMELKQTTLSQWDDPGRRRGDIPANRASLMHLFGLFTHPPFIEFQPLVYPESRVYIVFQDGAVTMWRMKIPSVPEDFFK